MGKSRNVEPATDRESTKEKCENDREDARVPLSPLVRELVDEGETGLLGEALELGVVTALIDAIRDLSESMAETAEVMEERLSNREYGEIIGIVRTLRERYGISVRDLLSANCA